MRYQPPFKWGATPAVPGIFNDDADASYVNGNPSTGTPGSYFPGQALEHPQRELIKLLTSLGITPDVAVLEQVAEGVSRGASLGIYGVCSGSANTYTIAKSGNVVVPKAYFTGMRVRTKPSATNTGASTATVFGVASKKILSWTGAALTGGELVAARDVELEYDATLDTAAGAWRIVPWSLSQQTIGTSLAKGSAQTIVSNTYTTINSGWTIQRDEMGAGNVNGTITIPAGTPATWYLIAAYGAATSGSTINRPYMGVKINGSAAASNIVPDGTSQPINLSVVRKLQAADVITLEVWHNSGADRNFDNFRLDVMRFG